MLRPNEDEALFYRNMIPDSMAIESDTKAILSPPLAPSSENQNVAQNPNEEITDQMQETSDDKEKQQDGDNRQDIEGEPSEFSSLEPPPVINVANVIQPQTTHFCLPPVNVNLHGQSVSSSYELTDDCVNENTNINKATEPLERPLSERQNFNFGPNGIEYDDDHPSNEHGATVYVPPLNFKNVPYLSLHGFQQNQVYQPNQGYPFGQNQYVIGQGFQPRPIPKQMPKSYRIMKMKNKKPYGGKPYKVINPIRPIPPLQPLSSQAIPFHSLAPNSIAHQSIYPHPNPFNPYAQSLIQQTIAPSQPSPFQTQHSIPSHLIAQSSIPAHLLSHHNALAAHSIPPHLLTASQSLSPDTIPSHLVSHQSLAPQTLAHQSIPSHPVTLQTLQGISPATNAGEFLFVVVDPSNQRPGIYNSGR